MTLRAYSTDELQRIIRYSADVLEDNGFNRARSFRAGGWQADDSVLTALAREGFTVDSSATELHADYYDIPYDFLVGPF